MPTPARFTPHTGVNQVMLVAPPFRERTCQFRWPTFAILTPNACTPEGVEQTGGAGNATTIVHNIGLTVGVADLPKMLQEAAREMVASVSLNAVNVERRWQVAVPVGARLPHTEQAGDIVWSQTTEPLEAELEKRVDPVSVFPAASVTDGGRDSPQQVWYLRFRMDIWHFKDASGREVDQQETQTTLTVALNIQYSPTTVQLLTAAIERVGEQVATPGPPLGPLDISDPSPFLMRPPPLA